MNIYELLKELYRTEQKLPERNFAKDHSFEEWLENRNLKRKNDFCYE